MHHPPRWPGDPFVRDADFRRRREGHHHDRGVVRGPRPPAAEGLDRRGRAAVRLLPVGDDHDRRRAHRREAEAHGRRHRRGIGRTHLPLRHLPAHSPGGAPRCDGWPPMSPVTSVSRREFLRIVPAAGAGLVLGVRLSAAMNATGPRGRPSALFAPNAFLQVDARGDVTIWASKSEMGQGVRTSLPMIVAEELDADWSRVRVEQAWVDPRFGDLDTGGSSSVRTRYEPMRRAGAAARAMLVTAAAQTWGADRSACRTERGAVVHAPTGRRIRYGDLVEKAAALPVPQDAPLKDPKSFRIVGKSLPRTDTPSKVDGSAVYGIDVKVPGMLYAAVARSPVFGGKAKHFDANSAKASPGVRAVVPISTGVAVVADSTWNALKGRDALRVDWDEGDGAAESSESLRAQFETLSQKPGKMVRDDGDAAAALEKAAKQLESLYELPFQAHATMEPQNATASWQKDRCEVWAPVQTPRPDRKSTRLNSSHVRISYAVFCLKKKNRKLARHRSIRRRRPAISPLSRQNASSH